MGRLIYWMNVSLDGYVAGPDGSPGWAEPSAEVMAAFNADTADVGTFLYGRRIYELMSVWETDPTIAAGSAGNAEFARLWQAADKVVHSATLGVVPTRRTRVERAFRPTDVETLKRSTTADLTVNGPTLAAQALRAGLVDEVGIYLWPVALGGGLRFLPDDVRLDLRLTSERRFAGGTVRLRYDVVGSRATV
ncbi:dihydrofolate reductase family protein [Georgenia sp. Z1491]|uniref:dihydrofolate reductase family protein n=1 Tax=Georgenia sp. Z1491 TaxID=3416707 RepID=UPI003CE9072B